MMFSRFARHLRRAIFVRAYHAFGTYPDHVVYISAFTPTLIQAVFTHFGLQLHQDDMRPFQNPVRNVLRGVRPMRWGETEEGSAEAYKAHIDSILHNIDPTLFSEPGHTKKNILTTRAPPFPFEVHGTTDVLIKARSPARFQNPMCFSCVRSVVELKRDIPNANYGNFLAQTRAELLATSLLANSVIFAVLTDLVSEWTILWISNVDGQRRYNRSPRFSHVDGVNAFSSVMQNLPQELRDNFQFCKLME